MGQYYLIVNPDKRQYLHPCRFGCGLKLMEFSNSSHGPLQALAILLAHANGRGGGDLATAALTPEEIRLVGSWAGDRIVVAGDYDDGGLWVPAGFEGRTYHARDVFGELREHRFGYDDEGQPCQETLYRAARAFFEDISDAVIRIVAKAEAGYGHPWAAIDEGTSREVPCWGVLPEKPPQRLIAGQEVWQTYRDAACSYGQYLVDELRAYLEQHPEQRPLVLAELRRQGTAPAQRRG